MFTSGRRHERGSWPAAVGLVVLLIAVASMTPELRGAIGRQAAPASVSDGPAEPDAPSDLGALSDGAGHEPKAGLGRPVRPERPAPEFELSADDGQRWRLSDQRGQPLLLFFGYTHCPDVCPQTLSLLYSGLHDLGPAGEGVRVALVSVDPERDSPAVLAEYVSAFEGRAVGLSGSPEEIEAVAAAYRVRYEKEYPEGESQAGSDYSMAHSNTVFVIDAHGQLRSTLNSFSSPGDVSRDLSVLLAEGPSPMAAGEDGR